MHLSPLFRAVGLSRRLRDSASVASTTAVHVDRRRRAAMGLDVQPVHGRHCICERCERQAAASS